MLDRQRDHCRFDLRRDTILEDWLLPAELGKRQLAAVIQLLEPVEAVATLFVAGPFRSNSEVRARNREVRFSLKNGIGQPVRQVPKVPQSD